MNYEIVTLEEKIFVGIAARTNNASPDMCAVIGGLWSRFYNDGIYNSIHNKINNKALGLYTDYEDEEKADYTAVVAYEVSAAPKNSENVTVGKIPAGKYAKFVVTGNMQKAVAQFWQELWKMDLPRSFVCDFEEYQNGDMENAEIHIYIGLQE